LLRSVKYGLYGAVLAGLVGGSVAWSSVDKNVDLVVDGQSQHVHTTASRVQDVLAAAGFHLGPHDLVAPSATSSVHSGSTIVYNRGRLLHLSVDGVDRSIWTTAPTVSEALAQLGYSTSDFTSVSRSQRLPLSPTDISVRTPLTVTVVQGGHRQQITTTDAFVGQLLTDLGITLAPGQVVSAAAGTPLTNGQTVSIQTVQHKTTTSKVSVPYQTTKTDDPTLPTGQTKVVTAGQNGVNQITYALVYVDGQLVGKTQVRVDVVTPPVNQVIHVGTLAPTTSQSPSNSGSSSSSSSSAPPVVNVSPGSAQAIAQQMVAARGWDSSQFSCLVTLWDHESGWRVNAANPSGAYGIPQALPGSKMASAGPDWQTNAATQISWGLSYIAGRYNNPCEAWSDWQANGGWY
jgi:resuscitation-promoting factor RpfB